MPKGMLLKSDGFAASLYDPDSTFTLRRYCEEMNLPTRMWEFQYPWRNSPRMGWSFRGDLFRCLKSATSRQ
jgi:hypothetical protein